MKALNSLCVALWFAFALAITDTCFAESKYQIPWTRWNVTIVNFQTDANLMAHCKSKDDNLGERNLGIGQQFDWKFRINFWLTTKYWCYFSSKRGHGSFEVFWIEKGGWLSTKCNFKNCIWAAKNDGFYLKHDTENEFEFIHPWEAGS